MAHVRVRCRLPPAPAPGPYSGPVFSAFAPDWTDVEVLVVKADGTEEPLHGATWVRFEAKEGTEPNRLTLCLIDAEIDVEADVELADLVPPT